MTAYTSRHDWSLWSGNAAQLPRAARLRAEAEAVTLRHCRIYRKGFRETAIRYPVEVLQFESAAAWIRRQGVGVGVATTEELDHALQAGIAPLRITMHTRDDTAGLIRATVESRTGRFVVSSGQQVAILESATGPQRVLIDVTSGSAEQLAAAVASRGRPDLIGLHSQLGAGDDAARENVLSLIAQMSRIRRDYRVVLAHLSLAEHEDSDWRCDRNGLRRVAEVLAGAVEDACARHRFPRPALVLSPRRSALFPSA